MSGPDRDVALPIPDAMHFALASWLETGRDSLRDMRDNFPGIYTVYRHSLMEPDFVAIGRLTIEHDRGTGAFRTKEEYRVNKSSFEMHGYLFRKHGRHYILSRHIDQEIRIQFFYINAKIPLGPRDRKNERFSGMFSDIQDHRYYSGRFVCVRGKPKTVTVIPADKLPSGIFRPIEKKPDLVGYVASF
jgi:hypothetical protein